VLNIQAIETFSLRIELMTIFGVLVFISLLTSSKETTWFRRRSSIVLSFRRTDNPPPETEISTQFWTSYPPVFCFWFQEGSVPSLVQTDEFLLELYANKHVNQQFQLCKV
jgi:hypothetical protein